MLRIRVEISQFTFVKEYRTFVTEASSIGLAPGHWPDEIEVWNRNTGNEAIFYKKNALTKWNELVGYSYDNASTLMLKVYNT
jgi:hypothetical protein